MMWKAELTLTNKSHGAVKVLTCSQGDQEGQIPLWNSETGLVSCNLSGNCAWLLSDSHLHDVSSDHSEYALL